MRNLWRRLAGISAVTSTYKISRWAFLRALGVVYFVAFLSLTVQVDGLIGSRGILPINQLLDAAAKQLGTDRFWRLPTLLWIDASDHALHLLCYGGLFLSLILIAGVATLPVLALLWACYLSLTVAGQEFLSFQWDVLLLETGFAAMFLAPWQVIPRLSKEGPVPRLGLFLVRLVLFKLMFMSGVVKLAWNDRTWWNWTALDFHFMTQPLPVWTSWYAHQLPHWMGVLSMGFMYFVELIVPLFIFGPRLLRLVAFASIVLFQLGIAATGNYGFFNLLTIVLCLTVPDDSFWPKWARRKWAGPNVTPKTWTTWVRWPVVVMITVIGLTQVADGFNRGIGWPGLLRTLREIVFPFRSINGYGLFRVMTTQRQEIIIEGSDDGATWRTYEFKWKPGDMMRRPAFVEPHMPRLDWQMWFAALGDFRQNRWFISFLGRLLEGSEPVLALLEHNPFPNRPPRYLRARLFRYRFTDATTRPSSGAWWVRDDLGLYCPVITR
ncbi:MAG: lipase maturation factor family protein [Tepidisphaeraceae bacterium]